MPDWVWYTIGGLGAAAFLAGGVLFVLVSWHAQVRRYVVRLVGRREAVRAGYKSLSETLVRLAEADDEGLMVFAQDAEQLDRRVLAEVARQQEILRDELAVMALPRSLVPAAEALSAAAGAVGREAGRVGEHMGADETLAGLACVDLIAAGDAVRAAEAAMHVVSEAHGVEEAAVYGGGLYI